jgi:hypothetical protein
MARHSRVKGAITTMSAAGYSEREPWNDAENARVVAQLEQLYAVRELPAVLRDPARVVLAAATRSAAASGRRWWSIRNALTVTAALVLLTGAGYAAVSLLTSTWQRDRGLDRAYERGLTTELQLAQTVGGVTVRVGRAYADVNRIAVGLSIDAPGLGGQVTAAPTSVTLRDGGGRRFEPAAGHGYGAAGSPYGASVVVFDAAGLVGASNPLELQLTIDRVTGSERGVSGPWEFRFTLPVHGARLGTATAVLDGGINVAMRVVAAPSETRVVVTAANQLGHPWKVGQLRVVIGEQSYLPTWGRCQVDGTCPLFVFTEPVAEQEAWLFVLEGIAAVDGSGVVLPGQWVIPVTFD